MINLLDKAQAAEFLGVSVRTVDYFRTRGNLPFHIIGGKLVRFDVRELERWALGREVSTDNDKDKQGERPQ